MSMLVALNIEVTYLRTSNKSQKTITEPLDAGIASLVFKNRGFIFHFLFKLV